MPALNFPNAPTVGQTYPDPPVEGQPQYEWDGARWLNKAPLGLALSDMVALAGHQTLTGGFKFTAANKGNIASPFTPDPFEGNYQYGNNNGAFTLNAPADDCAIDILITNTATAGAITFAGFTVAATNYGDPLTTTNGHKFVISIRRIGGTATYVIKALQ